jgi:tripartite-type tricarboxylate transporter receptor subunit TctC
MSAMGHRRFRFSMHIALATAMLLTVMGPARAQAPAAWPSKPVVIINPFPGGNTEIGARLYSAKLAEALGKPFIVDGKPGAGTVIANTYVAKAPPDGHVILITSASYTVVAATRVDLPYDPLRDLTPVSQMLTKPAMLMVTPSLPVNNYEEYLAYAKANPGALNFGTTGIGGAYHLVGAWLHGVTGTKVTFAHYKSTSQLFTDQMGGRIHVSPASVFNGLPYVKSGKLRAIAGISRERSSMLPNLKTVAEQGIPDFDYSAWEGIFTTGGVPRAIVTRLGAELTRIAKMPDVAEKFREDGSTMLGTTPDEFRRHVGTEIERWKRIVKENGIRAVEE